MSKIAPSRTKRREYEVDGRAYPSVTSILDVINKPFVNNWAVGLEREMVTQIACELYDQAAETKTISPINFRLMLQHRLPQVKAAEAESRKATDTGTLVHAMIEWHLHGLMGKVLPRPPAHEVADRGLALFDIWAESVDFRPVAVETVVVNQVCGYAGRADWVGWVNGRLTLGDIKTSKKVYPEMFLQNWAYRVAWNEPKGEIDEVLIDPVTAGLILRVPKSLAEDAVEEVVVPDDHSLFNVFMAAKRIYDFEQS